MRRVIASILSGMLLVIAIPFLIFWYGEEKREQLIAHYRVPPSFLEDILTKREGGVSSIMKNNEVIVCAIGGYGSVDELPQLNAQQKASIPKEKLPSEDIAWYLLFFASDSISRIYLIDSAKLEGAIDGAGAGCVSREGQFSVLTKKDSNGDPIHVLNLSRGKQ